MCYTDHKQLTTDHKQLTTDHKQLTTDKFMLMNYMYLHRFRRWECVTAEVSDIHTGDEAWTFCKTTENTWLMKAAHPSSVY